MPRARKRAHGVEDVGARLRIDGDGGLVEQHEPRAAHQRAAEVQPPAHAARVGRDAVVLARRRARRPRAPRHPLPALGARHAVELGEEREVLLRREARVERLLLRRDVEQPAHRVDVVHDVLAVAPRRRRWSAGCRVEIMESSVVLPAPFGPSRPKISPSRISSETPRTTSRPSYSRRRSRRTTADETGRSCGRASPVTRAGRAGASSCRVLVARARRPWRARLRSSGTPTAIARRGPPWRGERSSDAAADSRCARRCRDRARCPRRPAKSLSFSDRSLTAVTIDFARFAKNGRK